MIAAQTHQILTLRFCQGAKHDFQLFKDSKLALDPDAWYVADSGYQGLQKHHPSVIALQEIKHQPLTEAQKQHNGTALSKFRIRVEHVIHSQNLAYSQRNLSQQAQAVYFTGFAHCRYLQC